MNKPIYLENIQAESPRDHILIRMGYRKGITQLSTEDAIKIDEEIKKARSLCRLQGAYLTLKIAVVEPGEVQLGNGICFKSQNLSNLLKGCGDAVLMASTAGKNVVLARDREITSGDASYGLIIDATASETADAGLDWIQEFLNGQLARQARKLTTRYSPGYGDLDLSAQKLIFNALELGKLGITITDRYLLEPEKSVLAIAGVK
jgi:hypothetical protein